MAHAEQQFEGAGVRTEFTKKTMREAYERLNVHAIFPKPFDVEELRSTVGHLVA